MRKELVWRENELSFYLFKPDIFHLYDKEKPGKEEPVHRYRITHIIHQYIYLIFGGYRIFYCVKDNDVVSYVIYSRCNRHIFNSGNKKDYYVIFYYTYPEYRGHGYSSVLMKTLFRNIKDNNDFYETIVYNNQASIRAAEKIGFKQDGFVNRSKFLHTLTRTSNSQNLLFKCVRSERQNIE